MNMIKAMLLGFLAGAIATVTAHELINTIFESRLWTGWPRHAWNFAPNAFGVPQLLSDMFWGGLWGALFPVVFGEFPKGALTFKGLLYGLIGPALIGVFLAVPMITHRWPVFMDGNASLVIPVLCILGGFGAFLGWLYGFFAYKRLP